MPRPHRLLFLPLCRRGSRRQHARPGSTPRTGRQSYLEMFRRAARRCRKPAGTSRMWLDESSSGAPRRRISRPEIGSALGPAGAGFMLNPLGRSPDSRFFGPAAFPFLAGTVADWPVLHAHSGGAVLDFHQLPILLTAGLPGRFENNIRERLWYPEKLKIL